MWLVQTCGYHELNFIMPHCGILTWESAVTIDIDTITGIATCYCKGKKINVEVLARLFSTRQKQNALAYILEDTLAL